MTENETKPQRTSGSGEVQAFISLAFVMALMLVLLFWPAGTIDWRRGWLFLSLYCALTAISISMVVRDNRELIAARRKFGKGTKAWDAIVASSVILVYMLILPVSALDDVRFKWASLPDWAVLVGYVVLIIGFLGQAKAQSQNRHFEPTVRIQTDRDHKVVDTGLYARIRHPGYAFALLMCAGMALSLGSGVALILVVVMAALLAGRTLGEEAVLKEGLPGYREYMTRVKWRWIPYIW